MRPSSSRAFLLAIARTPTANASGSPAPTMMPTITTWAREPHSTKSDTGLRLGRCFVGAHRRCGGQEARVVVDERLCDHALWVVLVPRVVHIRGVDRTQS